MQVFGSNAPAIVVPPVPGSLLTHELTDHCTSSNYLYYSSVESIKTKYSIVVLKVLKESIKTKYSNNLHKSSGIEQEFG